MDNTLKTSAIISTENAQRIIWVDYMKVVGMFLIIYGHIFPRLYISQMISAFFVPVFFVLSGYLCTKTYSFINLTKRLSNTITFYFVLCTINYIIHRCFLHEDYTLCQFFTALFIGKVDIIGTMWFVYTLIIIRFVHNYIIRIKSLPYLIIPLCLLILVIAREYIRVPIALLATIISLPFFEIGYILSNRFNTQINQLINKIQNNRITNIIIVISLLFIVWILGHFNDYVTFYKVDYGKNILLFLFNALAGIFATFTASILLQKYLHKLKVFFSVMAYGNIFTLAFQMYFVVIAQTFIGQHIPPHFRYSVPAEIIASILILLLFYPWNHIYYRLKHKNNNQLVLEQRIK